MCDGENVLFVLYSCCWMLYIEMINMNYKNHPVYAYYET